MMTDKKMLKSTIKYFQKFWCRKLDDVKYCNRSCSVYRYMYSA